MTRAGTVFMDEAKDIFAANEKRTVQEAARDDGDVLRIGALYLQEKLFVALPESHRLHEREEVSLHEILKEPLILQPNLSSLSIRREHKWR
jgi:hypothetical protein